MTTKTKKVRFPQNQYYGDVNPNDHGGIWVSNESPYGEKNFYIVEMRNCEDSGIESKFKYYGRASEVNINIDEELKKSVCSYMDYEDWESTPDWEKALGIYQYNGGSEIDTDYSNNFNQLKEGLMRCCR
jgi:hypothetical protein